MHPLIPIFALGAVAIFRKKRPTSRAIIVIQGATTDNVTLEKGERLSIQFLEGPGEEWKMTDSPDGFLVGSAKIKWAPGPRERRLRAFDFTAKRTGLTKAEFVRYVEGGDPKGDDCSKIEILIKGE